MPIWLSILFAISAAAGAYFLAPTINQEFEYQNNRVEHVSKTVGRLNADIVALSQSTRAYNESLFYQRDDLLIRRSEALDKITELQWRLIDVSTIIGREDGDVGSVVSLQSDLTALFEVIQNSSSPEEQEAVISAVVKMSQSAENVLHELYGAARLKV